VRYIHRGDLPDAAVTARVTEITEAVRAGWISGSLSDFGKEVDPVPEKLSLVIAEVRK
jgi:hypothetical protein